MYLRHLFKFILTLYWLLFAYLASYIITDWNTILGPFDSTTQFIYFFHGIPWTHHLAVSDSLLAQAEPCDTAA